MDVEMTLRNTLLMLERMHVMGEETELHVAAKRNIRSVVGEIKKWKEAQKNDEAGSEEKHV